MNCETLVDVPGDPGDVVRPAAWTERRHDRVVLEHAELVQPVGIDDVRRQRRSIAPSSRVTPPDTWCTRGVRASGPIVMVTRGSGTRPPSGSTWPGACHPATLSGNGYTCSRVPSSRPNTLVVP